MSWGRFIARVFGFQLTGDSMFVTPAYAQDAGAAGGLISIIPFILIFVIMYFLLIRPQQKKVKEHQAMVGALRRGDQVVTQGGIIGKVVKVKEDGEAEVEIAEGVKVRILKQTIATVMSKTEPAAKE
jgi:preprotein translocase subunit YajC